MTTLKSLLLASSVVVLVPGISTATLINEVLEPPSSPGNAFQGTFLITPSESTWAFGVGSDAFQDTSISGETIVTVIPEPATFTLIAFALVSLIACAHQSGRV